MKKRIVCVSSKVEIKLAKEIKQFLKKKKRRDNEKVWK